MITSENGMGTTMLVSPANGSSNGFMGDQNGWWIVLLFILLAAGNGFGNGGGFGDSGVQRGFDQSAVMNGINGLNASVNNGFSSAEVAACNRAMGAMQTAYNNQLSSLQSFNSLQSQLAQCCCDNRLATAQTQALVQSENCADRYEAAQNTQAIISAINMQNQRIMDQLCADKIEAKNDIISQLRSELMYARGQASQDVQTAAIQAGQRALANEVEQYVAPKAVPAYVVQNPNCCGSYNYGCGCGYVA